MYNELLYSFLLHSKAIRFHHCRLCGILDIVICHMLQPTGIQPYGKAVKSVFLHLRPIAIFCSPLRRGRVVHCNSLILCLCKKCPPHLTHPTPTHTHTRARARAHTKRRFSCGSEISDTVRGNRFAFLSTALFCFPGSGFCLI